MCESDTRGGDGASQDSAVMADLPDESQRLSMSVRFPAWPHSRIEPVSPNETRRDEVIAHRPDALKIGDQLSTGTKRHLRVTLPPDTDAEQTHMRHLKSDAIPHHSLHPSSTPNH
jgi:hypothetical protein